MITVFTPTYNRAHLLRRLYDSLKAQTCHDFEWIIVDDASSDDTEKVIQEFKSQKNEFEIAYFLQPHGGKHRAINRGVKKARGELFFIVDSDDYLLPEAVENIIKWSNDIINDKKFAGVSGLKILRDGTPTSGKISTNGSLYVDASNLEREKYNLDGDQAEAWKTKLLVQYPFPEFDGEFFITEAVIWDKLAELGYIMRWYRVPVYRCDYLEGGLTNTDSRWRILENFLGFCERTKIVMRHFDWKTRMNFFLYFNWAAYKKKIRIWKRAGYIDLKQGRFWKLYLLDLPLFAIIFLKRKITRSLK